jgi:hypothetical protein
MRAGLLVLRAVGPGDEVGPAVLNTGPPIRTVTYFG